MTKETHKAYKAKWYLDHKEWYENYNKTHKKERKESAKRTKHRQRAWLDELKSTLFCKECGENRIVCLDFHHRDPKEKEGSITRLLYRASKARVLAEIAKCDVLCSNCHRVEHST